MGGHEMTEQTGIAAASKINRADVAHDELGRRVSVSGVICARTSDELRTELYSAIVAGEGDLLLHLGDAEVWDATGFGVLVGAHHHAIRRGRRLVVTGASPRVHRLMRRTRLSRAMLVPHEGDVRRIGPSHSLIDGLAASA